MMSMIAAGKFDNFIAFRICPRQTQNAHCRLCTGVDHPYHLNGRNSLRNKFGQFCFQQSRCTVTRSSQDCFLQSLSHHRMCMAKNHRPPGFNIINVVIAINIINMAAASLGYKRRCSAGTAERTHRTIHAAGNNFFSFGKSCR